MVSKPMVELTNCR